MKTVFALMMLLGTSSAFANVAIECGTDVNFDEGTVGKRSFLLSSEDHVNFTAYNSANQEVKNASVKQGENGTLVLTVVTAQALGGPVGVKYVVDNYRGENFVKANKFAVGGFAGGTKVGQLDCVVVEL